MISKTWGDEIQGKKIIMEAWYIELKKSIVVMSHGHHGDRGIGKGFARAWIDQAFQLKETKPLK